MSSDSLLALFKKSGETYFEAAHATPFCLGVRKIIIEFEEEYIEHEKPRLQDWRWEKCHEELFCLKYLCKKAADLKNDACLIIFVSDLKDSPKETVLPSFYSEFKNKLKQLNEERLNGKCNAILSMKADGNLKEENKTLMSENIRFRNDIKAIVQEENEKERERLKAEIIKELDSGIRCQIL